ncbi:alpha/beta hydrolase [Sphingomonas sp.]|jgi:pimeloyl-ACP methyl ester carboxylesterase|uniref:alpha/beta hydrolase family protein n=1 Tax=Sphingomonas sp. TaxID=28214 RepID=UPI002ED9246B
MIRPILVVAMLLASPLAHGQSAVGADPPADKAHPAKLEQVRYPTGGVAVPARLFLAAGDGNHGTVLLLHGFPGTELNLDLARAMQRAGWNVLAIHYRGVWGAPGKFSFAHTIEDARAALAWLRWPENAAKYRIDARKIVVLGHSMGGFDAVMIGEDPEVAGFVVISAADIGGWARFLDDPAKRPGAEAAFADDISYTNMTFDEMAGEIVANRAAWDWKTRAAKMAGRRALIVSSDDGNGPSDAAAADAIEAAGGPAPTRLKFVTDHSYNDHRIALQSAIVTWLDRNF